MGYYLIYNIIKNNKTINAAKACNGIDKVFRKTDKKAINIFLYKITNSQ